MARLTRVDLFPSAEVAIVHVMNRMVLRCHLLVIDRASRKNYDHRKRWLEDRMCFVASVFSVDLLRLRSSPTTFTGSFGRGLMWWKPGMIPKSPDRVDEMPRHSLADGLELA